MKKTNKPGTCNEVGQLFQNLWRDLKSWEHRIKLEDMAKINLDEIIILIEKTDKSSSMLRGIEKKGKKIKALYESSRKMTKKSWNKLSDTTGRSHKHVKL